MSYHLPLRTWFLLHPFTTDHFVYVPSSHPVETCWYQTIHATNLLLSFPRWSSRRTRTLTTWRCRSWTSLWRTPASTKWRPRTNSGRQAPPSVWISTVSVRLIFIINQFLALVNRSPRRLFAGVFQRVSFPRFNVIEISVCSSIQIHSIGGS